MIKSGAKLLLWQKPSRRVLLFASVLLWIFALRNILNNLLPIGSAKGEEVFSEVIRLKSGRTRMRY